MPPPTTPTETPFDAALGAVGTSGLCDLIALLPVQCWGTAATPRHRSRANCGRPPPRHRYDYDRRRRVGHLGASARRSERLGVVSQTWTFLASRHMVNPGYGSQRGGRVVRKALLVLATAGLLIATATSATAAKPGPGTSTGVGSVFVPNPVQSLGDESLTDQKDADAAVPAAAYHDVTLTNLDGSGFLQRRLRDGGQRDRQPGLLADEHLPLHAPPGRVRAGHGLLLGHRGADGTSRPSASASPGAAINNQPAGGPDQPVGRGQLVRHRPSQERAALRQGRRRRRRGRRGDPARVRPRDPLRAELLASPPRRRARSARASATTGR